MKVYIIYYYNDQIYAVAATWEIGEVYTDRTQAEIKKQEYINSGYKYTYIFEREVNP